ncbi:hypothetical protein LSTR_LSTR010480 [Laodelphax striatellus]|uniref:Uncharacterized protein n=1 Tax=Laodelphax striatellus TaxID=195883 RepID=A0A482X6E8_LAOST|nr:hypothetical protein LSTR_LSTR010480 [Laodelphax striatellus]
MNSLNKCCYISNKLFKYTRVPRSIHTTSCALSKSDVDVHEDKPSSASAEVKGKVKEPFIKNLFAGLFDTEMLVYPEYKTREELVSAIDRVAPIKDFFVHVNDSKAIDEEAKIPDSVLAFMRENNVFGSIISKQFQGTDLEKKEYMQLIEAVGVDSSVSNLLFNHSVITNAFLLYGNDSQKEKYLPRLGSGEWNFAYAFNEKISGIDIMDIAVTAKPMADKKWSLTGSKMWVANADRADFFLVVAKTWDHKVEDSMAAKTTFFIVDKTLNGIKVGEPLQQLGSKGISICNVTFEDTVVSEEDILGNIGDGYDIAVNSMSKGKLAKSASRLGLLKKLADMVSEYTIQTKISKLPLHKYEMCRYNLGRIMSDIYSIESLVYLIAGNQDDFDTFDSILEELAADIYSLETSFDVIQRCIDIIGPQTVLKDSPLERILRDSYSYLLHDLIPTDVKKIYVTTNGLQRAGKVAHEEIKKARNPLNFPMFTLKSFVKFDNALREDPKLTGELRQMVHPALGADADKLEHCLIRFEYIVKEMMRRWGKELLDRQYELINLSNYATSMLVMTAVLARASRSYCIGLQNADMERVLCSALCHQHHQKVKRIFDDLNDGPIETGRAVFLKIGEDAPNNKGYFFSHAVSRNY